MTGTYADLVLPTHLENWPIELTSLTMHQEGVRLSVDDAVALGKSQVELHEFWADHSSPWGDEDNRLAAVTVAVDRATKRVMAQAHAPGVFVRLGSRSPKDSYWWWRDGGDGAGAPQPITNGNDAMKCLLETSERINEDLLTAVRLNYRPWIWVREWVDIEPFQEFRCFMRDRKLIGISQYDYMGGRYFAPLERDASMYASAIEVFFKKFRAFSHMDSVVFDVYVKVERLPSGRGRRASCRLLEINPYFEYTDPCLFTWQELAALDGTTPKFNIRRAT